MQGNFKVGKFYPLFHFIYGKKFYLFFDSVNKLGENLGKVSGPQFKTPSSSSKPRAPKPLPCLRSNQQADVTTHHRVAAVSLMPPDLLPPLPRTAPWPRRSGPSPQPSPCARVPSFLLVTQLLLLCKMMPAVWPALPFCPFLTEVFPPSYPKIATFLPLLCPFLLLHHWAPPLRRVPLCPSHQWSLLYRDPPISISTTLPDTGPASALVVSTFSTPVSSPGGHDRSASPIPGAGSRHDGDRKEPSWLPQPTARGRTGYPGAPLLYQQSLLLGRSQ